jgi:hypothetical protein
MSGREAFNGIQVVDSGEQRRQIKVFAMDLFIFCPRNNPVRAF